MASSEDLDPDLWKRLPDEVLEQVLPRLPLEAIFRFRAVCKRWSEYPLSPSFRASCRHPTSQNPLLVAMRGLEDLRLAPVLTSHGKKWQGLGLSFLRQALLLANCDRITGMGSDGGLLCVSALNIISRSVILVCNPLTQTCKLLHIPWTVIFRQVIVRVEHPSGHYRIFLFGSDFRSRPNRGHGHGQGPAIFLYSSRSDTIVPLPRVTNSLARTCGAFQGEIFYTLSRDRELIAFDTDWIQTDTGISMTDPADGYKILVHDGRLFCATAKEGNRSSRDDVVEFRIYELNLATRQCVRLDINLQCLFVNDSPGSSVGNDVLVGTRRPNRNVFVNDSPGGSRYDWDFVVHRNCLLLVARSRVYDPRNTRWLEVFVSSQPFPSLAGAFCSPREKGRWLVVPRSLMLSTLRLDLNQKVEFA